MAKLKYNICVSGAAKGDSVTFARGLAKAVGAQIVEQGHVVYTGATTGLPYHAAHAAHRLHDDNVTSIGFSPAASRIEHINKYKLPTDSYGSIIYTGFGYMGRDVLLVRSCDALVMVGGRLGTLNELMIALEEKTPVGILVGSGGMTVEVENVLKAAKRNRTGIIFDDDPATLVSRLTQMIDHRYRKLK
jgi:uncharacterized protein (TIGR00725 family)